MFLKPPEYYFNGFQRTKGQRVIAEYILIDRNRLNEANYKYFPDISETQFVSISKEMLDTTGVYKDYLEVTRLCKTYIADPVIFDLCRQIEERIKDTLEFRFLFWGQDKWLFKNQPLQEKNSEENSV